MELLHRWTALCERLDLKSEAAEAYAQLSAAYGTPPRAYHNLEHVAHCLDELEILGDVAEHPEAIETAIWFHDAIYDPHAKDNEERSAELAANVLRGLGLDEPFRLEVGSLILVTRHCTPPQTTDEAIIIDVDLAILGQPPGVYDAYERAIRRECDWVPEREFWSRRTDILRRLLARETVFYTAQFRDRYEDQARTNLRGSLSRR